MPKSSRTSASQVQDYGPVVFEGGDAFYIEAGHAPTSSEPGTEYLQFSPTEQLQIVSETMIRNMQAMQQQAGG